MIFFASSWHFIRMHFWAFLSALLVLLLTVFTFLQAREITRERNERLFEDRAVDVERVIYRRISHYIQILRGAQSFLVSSDTVSRADWQNYISMLHVNLNYPGIQGIGYAAFIRQEQLDPLRQRIRAEGFPEFTIQPPGSRPVYTPIIYLEPFTGRNLRAFGFDMFSEARRRAALERALETGQPAMTSKVKLVQETDKDAQPGFLIYLPVYRDQLRQAKFTLADRRRQIKGFVYAPFRVQDIMTATLGREFTDVAITLYDGKQASDSAFLYASLPAGNIAPPRQGGMLRSLPLTIAGHSWLLEVRTSDSFASLNNSDRPYFILFAGTIISLLIFFVIWFLTKNRYTNELKQIITDNASAAIFIADNRGLCTFMNPAAEAMTGYTFAEIQGKNLHTTIHYAHPDGRPYPEDECPVGQAFITNQYVAPHEEWFIRKDGSFYPVICSATPIPNHNRGASMLLEVREITEEKRARHALEESESRFRIMADSAPVMIYLNDPAGNCLYLNKQWRAFTGQPLAEGMGKGWADMVHPDDRALIADKYEQALSQQENFQIEYRLRTRDNTYASVLTTGVPRFTATGEFQGYIGSLVDITGIKEAERKVKENADLLQKVFYQVPAIVGLIRASDQRYILANPFLSKLHGNRTLLGRTMREAHPELEGQGFFERIEKVLTTGQAYIGNEIPAAIDRNNDGQPVVGYFNLVYQPLLDQQGNTEAVLQFAVEVTELVASRKRLSQINAELSQKNEQLIRINNDLDNFVYTASHDLKAPIANLEGLTLMLKNNLASQLAREEMELLRHVSVTIEKLKQTISDLTHITKVQKAIQEDPEPLSFQKILEDVQADIKPLIEESGARITTDFAVPQIRYARKNLRSILYNLLSNAIKYRDSNRIPKIEIKTAHTASGIVLTITDNGLGIDNNKVHKLFAMFQRLHSHVEGTGIGLYIVKRIIENNGGRIEVASQPGEGTTFTVFFRDKVRKPKVLEGITTT